jgi:plastocyanin
MKTYLLLLGFVLVTALSFGATVTITNSGFAFSPDEISISTGDTVDFQLASIHDAVQVSEATWLANGNTPITSGFALPLGGGIVTGLTAGVHYYVCTPHASGGMKGKITVNPVSGIGDHESGDLVFSLNPNPSTGKFLLTLNESFTGKGIISGDNKPFDLEIFDHLGKKVYDAKSFDTSKSIEIDISTLPEGVYFVRINDSRQFYSRKLVKY